MPAEAFGETAVDFDAVLPELAGVDGLTPVSLQKAYCSQFHPKYNPQANGVAASTLYSLVTISHRRPQVYGLLERRGATTNRADEMPPSSGAVRIRAIHGIDEWQLVTQTAPASKIQISSQC
mgnify:CR=1 FL=1